MGRRYRMRWTTIPSLVLCVAMTVSEHIIAQFKATAQEACGSLAREFNLELVQEDLMTFCLIGHALEVRLYLYPGHKPSVNITLGPRGERWSKWRQESVWGGTGIWLDHLVACRGGKVPCPDTHFQTVQEMRNHVEALVQILRDVGNGVLRGDTVQLQQLAMYVDGIVRGITPEAATLDATPSMTRPKGREGL